MMSTTTSNLGLFKPGNDSQGWGDNVNSNFDTLDQKLGGESAITSLTITTIAITTITVSALTISSPDLYFA